MRCILDRWFRFDCWPSICAVFVSETYLCTLTIFFVGHRCRGLGCTTELPSCNIVDAYSWENMRGGEKVFNTYYILTRLLSVEHRWLVVIRGLSCYSHKIWVLTAPPPSPSTSLNLMIIHSFVTLSDWCELLVIYAINFAQFIIFQLLITSLFDGVFKIVLNISLLITPCQMNDLWISEFVEQQQSVVKSAAYAGLNM